MTKYQAAYLSFLCSELNEPPPLARLSKTAASALLTEMETRAKCTAEELAAKYAAYKYRWMLGGDGAAMERDFLRGEFNQCLRERRLPRMPWKEGLALLQSMGGREPNESLMILGSRMADVVEARMRR